MSSHTRFIGRTVIITGGADGLGFALAKRLAAEGAELHLLDVQEQKLAAAKGNLGDLCHTHTCDVTSTDSVLATVEAVLQANGKIDALVNSAGITGQTNRKSHEVDPGDFARVLDLNVMGTFLLCRAVLPHMVSQGYGRILNIASISGKEGNAGMVAYSTSKAAVIGMTKSMGKEYAETGVTINALAPAVIRTAMVEALPDEQVQYMTDKIPMRRCGTLEEFAEMAAFIVSPANSFTTAFTFDLSGGRAVY